MLIFSIIILISIFLLLPFIIHDVNQEKLKEKEEKEEKEYRKQKELKAEQEWEEYRKQKELKAKQAKEQKELKAKREKEEKKKKEAELLEKKRKYCQQLNKDFKSIGAKITQKKEFHYKIFAPENIKIDKLFNSLSNIKHGIEFDCFITDLNGDKLLQISEFNYNYCSFLFLDEEREKVTFDKGNAIKQAEKFLFCYLENRHIKRLETSLSSIIKNGINQTDKFETVGNTFEEKACSTLENSNYDINFERNIDCLKDNDILIIDYELPNKSNLSNIKEYKYIASAKEIRTKEYTDSYIAKRYENVLYSVTLRSLYEIFTIDTSNEIKGITFNGFITQINPATGIRERKCILSIQVDKNKFSQINLSHIDPKACFKAFKGVSAAKLIDTSPVTPILTFDKKDRRFVESKDISVNQGTNLAAMHWEDFEHLVRELFEIEFARNGGEVRVTQASRDGGVDAIIFDPDPLRGGKIVVQAKRYTNTVGVSAVRDLYGTVINEGANTGILITTSDYGHDSYEFAKDKPLKLLNGGHLLALLHKNGRNAHINIEEAKKINEKI